MEKIFLLAEEYIRNQKYEEAERLLLEIKEEENAGGRAEFDLGNIAWMRGNYQEAQNYYECSLKKGYEKYSVYQNLGQIKEMQGELKSAEGWMKNAVTKCENSQENAIALYLLCMFYFRNEMFLKAEKAAKELVRLVPESYQGHRLLVMIWETKQDYERAESYLDEVRDKFETHTEYFIDECRVLDKQEKYEEELRLINRITQNLKTIPEEILLKKISLCIKTNKTEDAREIIRKLFMELGTVSGAFSSMILAVMDQKYIEAGNIAHMILKQDEEMKGLLYYMTLYFHIFILYLAFDRNPPEEVINLMKKESDICLEWFKSVGFTEIDFEKALDGIFGRNCEETCVE